MPPKKLSAYGHFIEENIKLRPKTEPYRESFIIVTDMWKKLSPEERSAYIAAYESKK